MIYGYTIVYVSDVPSSLEFYETAFGFPRKMMTPEEDYGELISGKTTIAFASHQLGDSNFSNGFTKSVSLNKPIGIELVFISNQINEDFQKALDAGAELLEPISHKPWGQSVGYLKDPNGVIIEICTPVQGTSD